MEELFGYKENDLVGNNVKILMEYEMGKVHDEIMAAHVKLSSSTPGSSTKNLLRGEKRVVTGKNKQGAVFKINIQLGEVLEAMETTSLIRFIAFFTPIAPSTEQKVEKYSALNDMIVDDGIEWSDQENEINLDDDDDQYALPTVFPISTNFLIETNTTKGDLNKTQALPAVEPMNKMETSKGKSVTSWGNAAPMEKMRSGPRLLKNRVLHAVSNDYSWLSDLNVETLTEQQIVFLLNDDKIKQLIKIAHFTNDRNDPLLFKSIYILIKLIVPGTLSIHSSSPPPFPFHCPPFLHFSQLSVPFPFLHFPFCFSYFSFFLTSFPFFLLRCTSSASSLSVSPLLPCCIYPS